MYLPIQFWLMSTSRCIWIQTDSKIMSVGASPVFPGGYIPLQQHCLDCFCPRSRLQSWLQPSCRILLFFSTTGQLTCLIVSTLCQPESANVIASFDIWLTASPFPTPTFCNFIMNHIFKHALIPWEQAWLPTVRVMPPSFYWVYIWIPVKLPFPDDMGFAHHSRFRHFASSVAVDPSWPRFELDLDQKAR